MPSKDNIFKTSASEAAWDRGELIAVSRRFEISIDTTKFPEVSYRIIPRMSSSINNRFSHFSSVKELVAEYQTTGMGLIREKSEPLVSNDQSKYKCTL